MDKNKIKEKKVDNVKQKPKSMFQLRPQHSKESPAVPKPSDIPTDASKNSQIINSKVT